MWGYLLIRREGIVFEFLSFYKFETTIHCRALKQVRCSFSDVNATSDRNFQSSGLRHAL